MDLNSFIQGIAAEMRAAPGYVPRPVTLELEYIGEPYDRSPSHYRRLSKQMRLGSFRWKREQERLTRNRRPWVAEILGFSDCYGLQRRFIKGLKDYARTNSTGSRGVYLCFHLWPGHLYEVRHFTSWSNEDRYFCRVSGGRLLRLSPREAHDLLSGTRHA